MSSDNLPRKRRPKKNDLAPEEAKHVMTVSEAYRMRCEGYDYVEIAKALKISGGWVAAHKLVAEHYGELVADTDKQALREQEAGRLMALRAAIEPDLRRGEKWAVEADLRMTEQIGKFMGLTDQGGGSATAAVQVNITPPWESQPHVDVEIAEE
jgi:DNA-binding CsgD family transcriptional regulator